MRGSFGIELGRVNDDGKMLLAVAVVVVEVEEDRAVGGWHARARHAFDF